MISTEELLPTRDLKTGQRTEVWVADITGDAPELIFTSDELLLEAPNWTPDGSALLLNGNGLLWRLPVQPGAGIERVMIDDLPPINNDHVLDPPRGLIYLSANDGHLYVAPITSGKATRISSDPDHYHLLHGVCPDGATLAFVDLPRGVFSAAGRLALIPAGGGETSYPEAGSRHIDGPEYSPDGEWIYLVNTLDPSLVTLLGPGFAELSEEYQHTVEASLAESAYLRDVHPIVVRLGVASPDAAALGAASVVLHHKLTPHHSTVRPLTPASPHQEMTS
jgi:hypothetical protein